MPAYFEDGFFGNNTPAWHGMGTVVEGLLNAEDAIKAAKLDWEVEKWGLAGHSAFGDSIEFPGKYVTMRVRQDGTHDPLGIVGTDYEPLQNVEAFSFFDSIVENGEAVFETAGSLKDGKMIWILAKLPGNITIKGKDIVDKYLLLSNSHDGTTGVQIKLTPIRVVCWNTLSAALKGGSYNIRHNQNVKERVKVAAEAMGFANKMYGELDTVYAEMANKKMKHDEMLAFFKRCLKKTAHSKNQMSDLEFEDGGETEDKETRSLVRMTQLLEVGAGTDIKEIRGTVWHAYNAVTEFADHSKNYRNEDNKLQNTWFSGSGQILKVNALNEAKRLLKV